MSYEIYTSRTPNEPKFETEGLLITDRPYWSRLYLVGKGEHEGTTHSVTREQLYQHKFEGKRELAELLDRLFMRAHAWRLSKEVRAKEAQRQPEWPLPSNPSAAEISRRLAVRPSASRCRSPSEVQS